MHANAIYYEATKEYCGYFSLLTHLFASLELKFVQDSEKPKEETQQQPGALWARLPQVSQQMSDDVCELWQFLGPCTHLPNMQEHGCCPPFHLPNLMQNVTLAKADPESSRKGIGGAGVAEFQLSEVNPMQMQPNLPKGVWPIPVWAGHTLFHPGITFIIQASPLTSFRLT